MSQTGYGTIEGQVNTLSGNLYINGQLVSVRGMFNPPLPPFFAKVTFQYDDPSTLSGPFKISQGSQIGPNTISLILTNGNITLQIFGPLSPALPGTAVVGQVFLTGNGLDD